MESQNPPPQTQNGNMETTEGPIAQEERPLLPLLSTLLADKSLDHIGAPISLDYKKLWATKASANRARFGRLSMEDLDAIHYEIAPAAVYWELEHGKHYQYDQSPVPGDHPGLWDAKIVPVRLNLGEGESINSFAGGAALCKNDFTALSPSGLPHEDTPRNLERWRIYDSCSRVKENYPTHYIVWEEPESNALYARVPKPLEGMSRGGCDHCRIHDRERAAEYVNHVDDRRHVGGMRAMSAGDTAALPFSLCRFHWWYVWSGELLRQSQVFALEVLVSGDLRERWGISHMREFLLSMECQNPTGEQGCCDNPRGRRLPTPGRELEGRMYKIDAMIRQGIVKRMYSAIGQRLEKARSQKAQGATVASTDGQEKAVGGQQVRASTAGGLINAFEPARPPFTNGQSMLNPTYDAMAGAGLNGQPAFQVNGLTPSSIVAPAPNPQANGGPAPRDDVFLRPPPKGPRAWVYKQAKAKANKLAQNSGNSTGLILRAQPDKET